MKKKILICDDEQDILDVTKLALQRLYDVEIRSKVTDIFELIDSVAPDLILMDIWIPDIGGEEAVMRLKSDVRTVGIPIIMFSANNEIEKIARRAGSDGYISKPFQLSELKEYIGSFLSQTSVL